MNKVDENLVVKRNVPLPKARPDLLYQLGLILDPQRLTRRVLVVCSINTFLGTQMYISPFSLKIFNMIPAVRGRVEHARSREYNFWVSTSLTVVGII